MGKLKGREEYLKIKASGSNAPMLKIEQQMSMRLPELQALDLICGSLFQELEHANDEYAKILGKIIKTKECMDI